MGTIIIAIAIGLGIGIRNAKDDYEDFAGYIFYSSFGGLVGLAIGLILTLALPMDTYQKQYSYNIESLKDNRGVEGNFFLGSGQINGTMKYVFYFKDGDLFSMAQVDYDKAQIKYTEGLPIVTVFEKVATESIINSFAYDINLHSKRFIIEIPKGTIKNNFNLDSE